jgi:hypothetical protein
MKAARLPKSLSAQPSATLKNSPTTTIAFTEAAQQIQSVRATVGDVAASLRDYAEGIDASPERLAEIEDRLALIDRLKRKYGQTIAEVVAFGEEVARKLAEVEDRDEILKQLRTELTAAAAAYRTAASALTAERKAAATRLAKLAEAQINSLAMKVRFEVAVQSAEEAPALKVHAEQDPAALKGQAVESRAASKGHKEQESAALKGHDFSRAEKNNPPGGALAPEGNADVKSTASGFAKSGSKNAEVSQAAAVSRFVSGHDFSRADNAAKTDRALAPEGTTETNPTGPPPAGTRSNTASPPTPASPSSPSTKSPPAAKCPASCWPSK